MTPEFSLRYRQVAWHQGSDPVRSMTPYAKALYAITLAETNQCFRGYIEVDHQNLHFLLTIISQLQGPTSRPALPSRRASTPTTGLERKFHMPTAVGFRHPGPRETSLPARLQ